MIGGGAGLGDGQAEGAVVVGCGERTVGGVDEGGDVAISAVGVGSVASGGGGNAVFVVGLVEHLHAAHAEEPFRAASRRIVLVRNHITVEIAGCQHPICDAVIVPVSPNVGGAVPAATSPMPPHPAPRMQPARRTRRAAVNTNPGPFAARSSLAPPPRGSFPRSGRPTRPFLPP